jgi:AcrR family transcriptional regulator
MPEPRARRPDLLAGEELLPEPKQVRSRQKRAALLESALALFGERGFEATSVELIAQRAGVAVGAFYQHFASKRQLVLILMDQLLAEAGQLPALTSVAPAGDLRATVAALVRAGLQIDWAYAGAFRAWREVSLHDTALRELHRQILAWSAGLLEELFVLLARLPGARTEPDLSSLAQLVSQLFWGMVEQPPESPLEAERIVAALTDLILHGLFEDAALA